MNLDLFQSLLANVWYVFLVIVFFGGSIFVHELGHFLAARRRGMHVERFSIGFGPKIFSWRGKDGVEYRVSWLLFGGYVALPQLVDMGAIEGGSARDTPAARLPPLSFSTKLIVSAAGAAFNILFAFVLACIIWGIGSPTSSDLASTQVGYIMPHLTLPDGANVATPAAAAGLRIGDEILAVDGHRVGDWMELTQAILTGTGHTADGKPRAVFTIGRDGREQNIVVHPRVVGEDQLRKVGIAAGYELLVHDVAPGSPAAKAGFQPGDVVLGLDGQRVLNIITYSDILSAAGTRPVTALVERHGQTLTLTAVPIANPKDGEPLGLTFSTGYKLTHPSPFAQIWDNVYMTWRTLVSLVSPHSSIGLSKLAGPVGVASILHRAAEAGIRALLIFTILINVNLAIINLLPIPVLDGGHILFATIAKLRRRPLPVNFVAATQSVFIVLIFSVFIYISFFDVRRVVRAASAQPPASAATPAQP